jgi:hypothetical protein
VAVEFGSRVNIGPGQRYDLIWQARLEGLANVSPASFGMMTNLTGNQAQVCDYNSAANQLVA